MQRTDSIDIERAKADAKSSRCRRTSKLEQEAYREGTKIVGFPDSSAWTTEQKMLEYVKCKNDPVYFLKTYGVISQPIQGRTLFTLYPFQEELLRTFCDHKNVIVSKSRQMGISMITAGFTAWLSIFHSDQTIFVLTTKNETAKLFLEKVKLIYSYTPKWMKPTTNHWFQTELALSNGSLVVAKGGSKVDAIHSRALSLFVAEECAFIPDMEKHLEVISPTITTKGKMFLVSTPNAPQGFFYDICMRAKAKTKSLKVLSNLYPNKFIANAKFDFHLVELPWNAHPERNQIWYDKLCSLFNNNQRLIERELNANFVSEPNNTLKKNLSQLLRRL